MRCDDMYCDLHTHSLSFFLLLPESSDSSLFSLFFLLSLLATLFYTHRYSYNSFLNWGREGLLSCEICHEVWKAKFLDIFSFKKNMMFGKVYMYSNAYSLTRSQVYPHSKKCYMNTSFLRVRYQVQTTTDFLKVPFGAPSPSGYGGPNCLYQQCK